MNRIILLFIISVIFLTGFPCIIALKKKNNGLSEKLIIDLLIKSITAVMGSFWGIDLVYYSLTQSFLIGTSIEDLYKGTAVAGILMIITSIYYYKKSVSEMF